MSVSLQKGQKVSLTKENAGLQKVLVGLGWDPQTSQKGLFGGLLAGVSNIDCDAMAFLLDEKERIAAPKDIIYYGNCTHRSGCVKHRGDNLTGKGEGDDEQIFIDLLNLPPQYQKIVIAASIYQANVRRQHFGMIRNAFIRLVNADSGQEICIYNLSENYDGMRSVIFGELYRHNGEWKFSAIGQPLKKWSVAYLAQRYGLNWR